MKCCNSALIAGWALLATQAFAQSASAPPIGAAQAAPKAATKAVAKPGKPLQVKTADAGTRAAVTAQPGIITAAGSVLVLEDGIVANVTFAQVEAPADGFAYER